MNFSISQLVLSAPVNLFLNVTARCNLDCIYCSSPGLHGSMGNELNLDHFRSLAAQFDEIGIFKLIITGGEPLIRQDLFTILDTLKPHKRSISINTNATVVDATTARDLKSRDIDVAVSIDGPDAQTHNKTRPNSFDDTLAGIEHLLAAGLKPSLLCTLTRHNYHKVTDMAEFAHRLGLSLSMNEVDPIGNATESYHSLSLNQDIRRQLAHQLIDIKSTMQNVSAELLTFAYDFLPSKRSSNATLHPCGAAKQSCAITADGSVIPCNKMPDLICGNITTNSLKQIWQTEPMKRVRALNNRPTTDIPQCNNCQHVSYCAGGCRALAYLSSGDLLGSDPLCYAYKPAHS